MGGQSQFLAKKIAAGRKNVFSIQNSIFLQNSNIYAYIHIHYSFIKISLEFFIQKTFINFVSNFEKLWWILPTELNKICFNFQKKISEMRHFKLI